MKMSIDERRALVTKAEDEMVALIRKFDDAGLIEDWLQVAWCAAGKRFYEDEGNES